MSSSIIEILRSANEEVEGLEKACALAFHYKDDHPREAVIAERIVKVALDRIQTKSREILELYADYDLRRKHENEIFSGQRFVSEEHRNEVQRQTGISVRMLIHLLYISYFNSRFFIIVIFLECIAWCLG